VALTRLLGAHARMPGYTRLRFRRAWSFWHRHRSNP